MQEVAFTLANGIAYVQAAIAAGLSSDDVGPRIAFFFNGHSYFLEEIAKFRAARRLWARIMRDRFGAKEARSCALRFHTQTAGSTLTAQQPLGNVVRVTVQALAAVLGGTQSLHTNAYDEALALPPKIRRAWRSGPSRSWRTKAAWPISSTRSAGSYAIESLTSEIEERARELIDQIDQMGGAVAAIERGFPQREIERRAYEHQKAIEEKRRIVVGVNEFREEEPPLQHLHRLDAAVEQSQLTRVVALRAQREGQAAKQSLDRLTEAARGTGNLLPPILECVKALCTLGEISDALRGVFGEHQAL